MAKEYIERAKAKEELLSWARCIKHPEHLLTEDAMCVLDSMKAADVVEVRHGRWEFVAEKYCSTARCSNCKKQQGLYINGHKPEWNYCPNCGARMDGE